MSLEQLSKTVDFVQDATPSASDVNDGETYLDTSQSPPQLKVFDSSVGGFIRPRSVQNLDAPVSGAGATQSDIETAVDNSTTASTVSTNLDAKVSNAGQGVDWASKTPKQDQINPGSTLNISGSGYLLSLHVDTPTANQVTVNVTIDGTTVIPNFEITSSAGPNQISPSFIWRFDSTLDVSETTDVNQIRINYVLD